MIEDHYAQCSEIKCSSLSQYKFAIIVSRLSGADMGFPKSRCWPIFWPNFLENFMKNLAGRGERIKMLFS